VLSNKRLFYEYLAHSIIALSIGAPATSYGLSVGVSGRAGAMYTDNLTLEEDGEREEWVGIGALGLWAEHQGPSLVTEVVGEVEHRDYRDDEFEDETLFSMDAVGALTIYPDALTWWTEDYFRQATIDPFAPPTPTNRQDANFFSTGPEATARLAPVHSFVAGARYSQYYFSRSILDSIRPSAYGRWEYDVSTRTDVSLNAEAEFVDYADESINDNYERVDGFVTVETELARGSIELDGGLSRIDRNRLEDVDGYLARVLWEYELNTASSISLYGLSEYTDVGQDIYRSVRRGTSVGIFNEQLTGDIYQVNEAELSYRRDNGMGGIEIAARTRKEDYEDEPRDRDRKMIIGEIDYGISRLTTGIIRAWYREDDYEQIDRSDQDTFFSVVLDNRLGRSLYIDVELSRRERDSSAPGASFDENRGLIMLRYHPETIRTRFVAPQSYE